MGTEFTISTNPFLLFISNTIIGRLFSLQSVTAVRSITLSSFSITSLKVRVSYLVASGSISGSAEYTPSTLVPFIIISALISIARRAAAVSVLKYGFQCHRQKSQFCPFPSGEYPFYGCRVQLTG